MEFRDILSNKLHPVEKMIKQHISDIQCFFTDGDGMCVIPREISVILKYLECICGVCTKLRVQTENLCKEETVYGTIDLMQTCNELSSLAKDGISMICYVKNVVREAVKAAGDADAGAEKIVSDAERHISEAETVLLYISDYLEYSSCLYQPAMAANNVRMTEPKPENVPDKVVMSTVCAAQAAPDYNVCNGKENEIEMDSLKLCDVQFSAVVQKKAELSEYVPISIIMYEDEYRGIVEERLTDEIKETRGGYHRIRYNSKIKVILSSKDIQLDDSEEEGIWCGKYLEFGFIAEIPGDYSKKQILFSAAVYINDLIATRLKFFVDITKNIEQKADVVREDINTAFVSYASNDRDKVAAIVQGMKKARPDMDIFFDVETLRSGEMWEDALKTEIDSRSIFYLCWSKSARVSKWVDFEWRYALAGKGYECIEPIPIDPPDICPPPTELEKKHFNDKMVYMIKALEYLKRKSAYITRTVEAGGERIKIDKSVYIFGKQQGNVDYVIQNPRVSRMHAQIVCEDGEYYIIDLNSTNKTFVDGAVCVSGQKAALYNGSVIKIADEVLTFELI